MVQIFEGSFTSTGAAINLTGAGWAADAAIIKGGTQKAAFWTKDMPAASLKAATGAVILQTADGITQHASGITIAADNAGAANRPNISGTVYHYILFRDNGAGDFAAFSFTGTGSAGNQTTAAFSGTPRAAFLFPGSTATARAVYWATDTMTAGQSKQLVAAAEASRITGLVSGGISLSNSALVNASGETYYVVLFKDVPNICKTLTYNSQAAGFAVTGVGFAPQTILINVDNTSSAAAFRGAAQTGDAAYLMDATTTGTGRITAEGADGFTVGTTANTNDTATVRPYHVLAFLSGTSSPPAGGGAINLNLLGVG